jgi:hypothetical protein
MTALGGQDVKRTFSTRGGILTGLPAQKTHQAPGQNLSDIYVRGRSNGLHGPENAKVKQSKQMGFSFGVHGRTQS